MGSMVREPRRARRCRRCRRRRVSPPAPSLPPPRPGSRRRTSMATPGAPARWARGQPAAGEHHRAGAGACGGAGGLGEWAETGRAAERWGAARWLPSRPPDQQARPGSSERAGTTVCTAVRLRLRPWKPCLVGRRRSCGVRAAPQLPPPSLPPSLGLQDDYSKGCRVSMHRGGATCAAWRPAAAACRAWPQGPKCPHGFPARAAAPAPERHSERCRCCSAVREARCGIKTKTHCCLSAAAPMRRCNCRRRRRRRHRLVQCKALSSRCRMAWC